MTGKKIFFKAFEPTFLTDDNEACALRSFSNSKLFQWKLHNGAEISPAGLPYERTAFEKTDRFSLHILMFIIASLI